MAKKYEIVATIKTTQIVTPPEDAKYDLAEAIKREYPAIMKACMKQHVNDAEVVDIQVREVIG